MSETKETLQDVKKQIFDVKNLEKAGEAIQKAVDLANAENKEVVWNFNPDNDLPENYGIVVGPINKRHEGQTTVNGVYVGAIPDVSELEKTEVGQAWILDTLQDALAAKVANAARPKANGERAATLPLSIEDFVTSNRPEGTLTGYNKLAPDYVKLLKTKGMKMITVSILRQVLQSAAFAEQQFPKVPQTSWEKMLDSMIAKAGEKGLNTTALEEWKDTRDSAGLPDEDVDLSDLDFESL